MNRRLQPLPSALAAGLLALACSDAAPDVPPLDRAAQAIIGGLVATNPLLDHTGTLTFRVRDTGQTDALLRELDRARDGRHGEPLLVADGVLRELRDRRVLDARA